MTMLPEINLFKAVLLLAAKDAFLFKNRINKDAALHFFESGKDLEMVCDYANVDHGAILRIVNEPYATLNEKYRHIKEILNISS